MTTHHFAVNCCRMAKQEHQRPEGALIDRARSARKLTARHAAREAGISDSRWRQIINGYLPVGGQEVPVIGPDDTIARMARAVGVTPDQLREAGRPEAADLLLTLAGMQAESEWQAVGTALDRLLSIRDQLDGVIAELKAAPVTPQPRAAGAAPEIDVGGSDEV